MIDSARGALAEASAAWSLRASPRVSPRPPTKPTCMNVRRDNGEPGQWERSSIEFTPEWPAREPGREPRRTGAQAGGLIVAGAGGSVNRLCQCYRVIRLLDLPRPFVGNSLSSEHDRRDHGNPA